jgi:hypothetical protein
MKKAQGRGTPIPRISIDRKVSGQLRGELLAELHARFEKYRHRHDGMPWDVIRRRIESSPEKLSSLFAMERTGGEPDVIGFDANTGEYIFCDCAEQSPAGRRSICYDGAGQAERERKGVYPAGNAVELAAAIGIELLDEKQYRDLQQLGEFDTKTESWLQTPADIRERGGAIFADRRYGHVFVFHNSAPSFYASRGFRGRLRV